jgi:hypothetical protein
MVYKWGGENGHPMLLFYKRDMEGVKTVVNIMRLGCGDAISRCEA